MSADLPEFEKGGPLTAGDLNAIAARVRELQQRQQGAGMMQNRVRRVVPGRQFAFRLATQAGVIYYRQGWIDVGNGRLQPVGEKEWNPVCGLQACTLWLEIKHEGDVWSAEVVRGDYDDASPEMALRRRLGYVRVESEVTGDGEEAVVYYCIQVNGGLMSPLYPRRLRSDLSASDSGRGHAGFCMGSGYEVDDKKYRNCVSTKWAQSISDSDLGGEHGGMRLVQLMLFDSCLV